MMRLSASALAGAAGLFVTALAFNSGTTSAQSLGDTAGTGSETAMSATGEQTYREICQACHLENAQGGTGAGMIPALASDAKLADADFTLKRIMRGYGGMPAFADMLTPEQIAGVTVYIRTHFGNDYHDPVSVDDVKKLMPQAE